jgi:hypothetical protein
LEKGSGSDSLGGFELNTLTWKNNLNEQMVGRVKKYSQ